jgi:hypothetical protein
MPLPDQSASAPGKVGSSCRLRQLDARDRLDSAPSMGDGLSDALDPKMKRS